MKKISVLIAACLLSFSALADNKPSDASLDELLTITDSQKLVDGMWPQIEATFNNAFQESLGNMTLNIEQQKVVENMSNQLSAVYKDEFSWQKMKPMFIKIYKDSFSQEEVNGMLKFYKSKAGKAVTEKMPLVIQATMVNVQEQMTRLMPKLQKIQQDALTEIEAKAASARSPE